jgi:hypothetical protein
MIDSNGDILKSEQYEWSNGRLVRMTANGILRNYIYGKTLQDTVYVEPSDEGLNYHSGYNGTVGKIPEEDDPKYWLFAINPYGYVSFEDEEKKEHEEDKSTAKILAKSITHACVNEDKTATPMLPKVDCIRYERKDIPSFAPKNGLYGHAEAKLSISFECKCDASGKYRPSFKAKSINEKIEVYQSVWRYNSHANDFNEYCWGPGDLQVTYNHEAKHIKNARYVANSFTNFVKEIFSDTKKECEKEGKLQLEDLIKIWNNWYEQEQEHKNDVPKSPVQKKGVLYEHHCYY